MNRNMCTKYNLSDWDSERYVDQLILDSDDTYIACPTIDSEPDLLISKVRQHYMKHMVKLLSVNYETHQKLLNKNIYLPSGIWRCAQLIEMKAAQKSMVIQLYRANIVSVIKTVKSDTDKGRLHRFLLETMRTPPNEKKTQTSTSTDSECCCKCHTNNSKRRRKSSQNITDLTTLLQSNTAITPQVIPQVIPKVISQVIPQVIAQVNPQVCQYKIPVAINMQTHTPEPIARDSITSLLNELEPKGVSNVIPNLDNKMEESMPIQQQAPINKMMTPMHTDNEGDDIMMQLEKLFHTEQTDEDLFDATFNIEANLIQNESVIEENISKINDSGIDNPPNVFIQTLKTNDLAIENHAAQIRSLDERLATLTGILIHNETSAPEKKEERRQKHAPRENEVKKKKIVSKWHCEEYFLKKDLLETLYQIGDNNRSKLARIKTLYLQLFGEDDDDDESILSPIEDSPHLILSCKTRISLWVLTTLTPYYGMGRIRGKNLFKSVVKYLIDLIFKCKQYPDEKEVISFVQDFIQNHALITCEADFRDIIDNVRQEPYVFA